MSHGQRTRGGNVDTSTNHARITMVPSRIIDDAPRRSASQHPEIPIFSSVAVVSLRVI
jgi:hypothetical protein